MLWQNKGAAAEDNALNLNYLSHEDADDPARSDPKKKNYEDTFFNSMRKCRRVCVVVCGHVRCREV